jgi:serine/threonine protein kinase
MEIHYKYIQTCTPGARDVETVTKYNASECDMWSLGEIAYKLATSETLFFRYNKKTFLIRYNKQLETGQMAI